MDVCREVPTYCDLYSQPIACSNITEIDYFTCLQTNLSFIHIPKTAGNSIRSHAVENGILWSFMYDYPRLAEGCDEHILDAETTSIPRKMYGLNSNTFLKTPINQMGCSWQHIPPSIMSYRDTRSYWKAPYRFCVVRNPYDRILSEYTFRFEHNLSFVQYCKKLDTFDAWIRSDVDISVALKDGCHLLPSSDYVSDDFKWAYELTDDILFDQTSDRSCNIVVRFEYLIEDLQHVYDFAGINLKSKKMFHKFSSKKYKCKDSNNITNSLSHESILHINKVFHDDFKRFNYTMVQRHPKTRGIYWNAEYAKLKSSGMNYYDQKECKFSPHKRMNYHCYRQLHIDPNIYYFPHFLNDSEIKTFNASFNFINKTDAEAIRVRQGQRITKTWYLNDYMDNHIINNLKRKLNNIIYFPPQHKFSKFKISKQDVGEIMNPHLDDRGRYEFMRVGSRYVTALFYLNDVEKGGETIFNMLQVRGDIPSTKDAEEIPDTCNRSTHLKVTPQKGGLLVFFNKNSLNETDSRLMHSSCQPESNPKYIAVFRED